NKLSELKNRYSNVLQTSVPTRSNKANFLATQNIQKRSAEQTGLTSFEYCVVIAKHAELLNIPFRFVFGSVAYPRESLVGSDAPHIWCEVIVDDEILLLDPYLEDITGYDYFGAGNWGHLPTGFF